MNLTLEIIKIVPENKLFFRVTDNLHEENSDIIGCGWTIADAADDFFNQFQKDSFYDDDTPILISRDSSELKHRIKESVIRQNRDDKI